MTPTMRFLQRLVILGLGALTIWFVVFVVFEEVDQRMPLVLAVAATIWAAVTGFYGTRNWCRSTMPAISFSSASTVV